jgi:hypothetical protein
MFLKAVSLAETQFNAPKLNGPGILSFNAGKYKKFAFYLGQAS